MRRNPIVEIDPTGVVISVEFCPEGVSPDSLPHTEHYAGLMTAGLINAHTHLELSYMEGRVEGGGGFTHFSKQIAHLREEFASQPRAIELAIKRADAAMSSYGVVGVGDIANSSDALPTKESSSIEYYTFVERFGLGLGDDISLPQLHSKKSSYTPHSTYSLQDGAMGKIIDSGGDAPLSIHFMESAAESELYSKRGDIYEVYANKLGLSFDFLHHSSPAKRLIALVPRDRKVLLIHNTCVTQGDIDIIMEHFTTPPTWVICPRSNRHITGLTPPVELLRANNLEIAIGTDSLASAPSLSPLDELKLLPEVPLAERLTWASKNGAAALGLAHAGEVEVGKRCGINIISGIDYTEWQLLPHTTITPIRL